jgi:hypothetical protein
VLNAVSPDIVEKPPGPREPAPGWGHLSSEDQLEAEPERATDRTLDVAIAKEAVMGPRPNFRALCIPAGQVRSDRESLKVLGLEGALAICFR